MKILEDPNSMLIWWPKVKDLPIPMPETIILPELEERSLDRFYFAMTEREEIPSKWGEYFDQIIEATNKIGFPLFLRTDLCSGKHRWNKTCYVENRNTLLTNIVEVIEYGLLADIMGLNHKAIVLRKFIELDWKFKCIYDLPIAPERRYFINKGKVQCHHPYWPEEALKDRKPDKENWKELLKGVNKETKKEIKLLTSYAELAASIFYDSFWSIDFAKSKKGIWYLIDMATGKESWHPKCKYLNAGVAE